MCLFIAMIMMGAVNLVICNPEDHVFTENCKPPLGYEVPDQGGNSTTPSGLIVYENPIRPIEKCCPECSQCIELGGTCKIRWITDLYPQFCDFTEIQPCRDYSCTCCIKCGDDECSPCAETGGECRDVCRADEQEDTKNKCGYHKCKCCKKCEATIECDDVLGNCVTSPDDCPVGSFASTGCCGGCYCCKPVFEGTPNPDPQGQPGCSEDGAYCSETDECASGFYSCYGQCLQTLWENGLERTQLGYCCVPKQATPVRRSIGLPNLMNQLVGKAAWPVHGRIDDQF